MEETGRFLMQRPQALLLLVAGLVLLVLRHFHSGTLGKGTDCIGIAQALHFHHEVYRIATLVAAEAIVNAFIRRNRKGSRLFTMERTQSKEIRTAAAQGNILANHIFDGIALHKFVNKCRWECHGNCLLS